MITENNVSVGPVEPKTITLKPCEDLYIEPVAYCFHPPHKNKLRFFRYGEGDIFIPWEISASGLTGQHKNSWIVGLKKLIVAAWRYIADYRHWRYNSINGEYRYAEPYWAVDVPGFRFSLQGNLYLDDNELDGGYVHWRTQPLINRILASKPYCANDNDDDNERPSVNIYSDQDKDAFIDWLAKCIENDWEVYFIQHIDT